MTGLVGPKRRAVSSLWLLKLHTATVPCTGCPELVLNPMHLAMRVTGRSSMHSSVYHTSRQSMRLARSHRSGTTTAWHSFAYAVRSTLGQRHTGGDSSWSLPVMRKFATDTASGAAPRPSRLPGLYTAAVGTRRVAGLAGFDGLAGFAGLVRASPRPDNITSASAASRALVCKNDEVFAYRGMMTPKSKNLTQNPNQTGWLRLLRAKT